MNLLERRLMKGLSFVFIRIMAVYFFVWNLYYAGNAVASILSVSSQQTDTAGIIYWAAIIPPILMLIVSSLLWMLAKHISVVLVKGIGDKDDSNFDFSLLLNLSFVVIGLVMTAFAIPSIISNIYSWVHISANGSDVPYKLVANVITDVLKLLIGVWFVFGFRGLADFVKKLGRAGIYSMKDENSCNGESDK